MLARTSAIVNLQDNPTMRHVPRHAGELWFVDGVSGSDSNTGKNPDTAFATIGKAITEAAAGDAITIKAATYTETGLDLNKNNLELSGEIGTLIDPASGTALTVSGNGCSLCGYLKITPAAGEIGLKVDGQENCLTGSIKIAGGATSFDINGVGNEFRNCKASSPTSVAFDIKAAQNKLYECSTAGTGGATYGYKINNSCDRGLLINCTSVNHATAGFYIDTGSTEWTLLNCSSGSGDGKWRDVDLANIWANFHYESNKFKSITLDADATTKAYNLFKITGTVEIDQISAHVDTVFSSNHTNCHIDLWDGATSVDLSDPAGLTLSAAPAGSQLIRNADASVVLDYASSASCFLLENSNFRLPNAAFVIGQKASTDTWIRFVHTTTDSPSSGELHWHIQWRPVSDDGFVEAV